MFTAIEGFLREDMAHLSCSLHGDSSEEQGAATFSQKLSLSIRFISRMLSREYPDVFYTEKKRHIILSRKGKYTGEVFRAT
jgi:hypothetical protein